MWSSYKKGLSGETHKKQIAHFEKWRKHIQNAGIRDVWLSSLNQPDKNFILAGFAQEIRDNNYGKVKTKKKLMADTVASTISSISTTFRENGYRNPSLDDDNQRSIFLQRQIRGFKREDPLPQGQQCLPLSAFKEIYNDTSCPLHITLGQLISGALFFACRSCEYSKVNNDEDRKTKTLLLENIRFFKDYTEISNISHIDTSDFVQITFISQKTELRHQSIIQHKSFTNFCPVKIWASIKKRVLSYPNTSEKSKVNLFLQDNRLVEITSEAIRKHIRRHVLLIDPLQLHFNQKRIGTHTIRTSFAMILHSVGIAKVTVMLIGRWASDAYLRYIRHNLADFSKNISAQMVKSNELFYNIPAHHIQQSIKTTHSQLHGLPSVSDDFHPNTDTKVYNVWKTLCSCVA